VIEPVPLAKSPDHLRMPWRRNPEHSSMIAIVRITGFRSIRAITCTAGSRVSRCPLDASATSKSDSPAFDGVSRTHRNDSSQNPARIAAGTRNSQASPWLSAGDGAAPAGPRECTLHAGHAASAIRLPQSNAK
jgi:hypothetical protein